MKRVEPDPQDGRGGYRASRGRVPLARSEVRCGRAGDDESQSRELLMVVPVSRWLAVPPNAGMQPLASPSATAATPTSQSSDHSQAPMTYIT